MLNSNCSGGFFGQGVEGECVNDHLFILMGLYIFTRPEIEIVSITCITCLLKYSLWQVLNARICKLDVWI